MHYLKRMRLAALLLALLAMLLARPPATRAASSPRCGAWSIVKSPNPDSGYDLFEAVAADSPSDIWAVGYGWSSGPGVHTLIEHYNGATCQVAPSPSAGASALAGVVAISSTDVWAVGYAQDGQQALIEHWDGAQWSIVANPAPPSNATVLKGVSAVSASDVWAVGLYIQGYVQKTLTEHFDGSRWRVVKSPSPGARSNDLRGVTVLSASDVWAVGLYSNGEQSRPLTEHWNGAKWQVVPAPYQSTPTYLLGVTALSSTDVWAVGYEGATGYSSDHWNGKHWKIVPVPQSQYGPAMAVSASSSDNIWSVGNGPRQALAAHWNGKHWKAAPPVNPPSTENWLNGVVMTSAQTVWAVGRTQNSTLVEYYC